MRRDTIAERIGRTRALRRRDLLKVAAFAGALVLPMPALARIGPTSSEKTLKLHNLHTDESVEATYWADGAYVPEAFPEIDRILRDRHTGAVKPTDPELVELLYRIQTRLGNRESLEVLCGYRTPRTNAMLLSEGLTPAKHSYHLYGKAVDFRVPGRDIRQVRKVAIALQAGGVGYYPRTQFIHVDVGPVRHWESRENLDRARGVSIAAFPRLSRHLAK